MARKKIEKPVLRQEPVRTPNAFDYPVNVIPYRDSRGNNKLDFTTSGGKSAKQLTVQASEVTGKRLVVAWQVDTTQVPGETAALIQITFPQGTPFSYIIGPIEIDDSSGTGVNLIWKRVKRKGNVIPGVYFYYSVSLTTQDGSGGTRIYVAELADPMVIVD
jgi:hypothetical protein